MPRICLLTIHEVQYLAHQLAKETMTWDEPIPEFGTRYPNILESCLAAPFQTFDKRHLYHGLTEKAAILFYLLIKNHPFQNGNKRIAVATLLIFLFVNQSWLTIDSVGLYRTAIWVAESPPEAKPEVFVYLTKWIGKHITKVTL